MKANIVAQPIIYIRDIDKELIELLIKQSKTHYDFKCRSASEEDGFLRDWEKCNKLNLDCKANIRDLDVLLTLFDVPKINLNKKEEKNYRILMIS